MRRVLAEHGLTNAYRLFSGQPLNSKHGNETGLCARMKKRWGLVQGCEVVFFVFFFFLKSTSLKRGEQPCW